MNRKILNNYLSIYVYFVEHSIKLIEDIDIMKACKKIHFLLMPKLYFVFKVLSLCRIS